MTKNEVVQRIGYPFKKGFEEENGKYFDYWYYKESIYTLDSKYSLETVLVFYKDILLKIIPGKEERIYDKEPDARIIIRRE